MSNACVDKVIYGLSELQIKMYQAKFDDYLCLCKKQLLELFGKKLQHILMLSASVKYLNEDWSINYTSLITKLKDEMSHVLSSNDEVISPIVEKMYIDIIQKILDRFPVLTPKLLEMKHYDSFLMLLVRRVLKVFDIIQTLFMVTYPICKDFKEISCSSICLSTCTNMNMFNKTTVIIPTKIIKFGKFESLVYDIILSTMIQYINAQDIQILVCGKETPEVTKFLANYAGCDITVTDKCIIPDDKLKVKTEVLCHV